ncbi:nitroreductase family protein [Pontibacter korlensis]|uniref:nitroreductase family protein n=1 Tax=Pontibacter korlensis TaxID=400092 RepID=UPI000A63E9AC
MDTTSYPFIPYQPIRYTEQEMLQQAELFYSFMDKRRSVREFSDKPVLLEVIEQIVKTASTAPSGAHKQP